MEARVERRSGKVRVISGEFQNDHDAGRMQSVSPRTASGNQKADLKRPGLQEQAGQDQPLHIEPDEIATQSDNKDGLVIPSPFSRLLKLATGHWPLATFRTDWLSKACAAEKTPHIVHADINAFFASVEQVLHPKLSGKPVLVGRGVVASASYEAKFCGVKTAMSFRDALHVCPQAIVVPGKYEHYAEFAERVRRILETYTSAVEPTALDGFYLDFLGTGRLYPDFEATLRRLQAEILGRTGLSVSIGAALTKVVASIASRLEQPRGFRIVPPGTEEVFLAPLPVDRLYGIDPTHSGALVERGIATIGQLRMIPKPVLVATFGEAIGEQIWEQARGLDGREVMTLTTPKSVSRETAVEGGTIDAEFLGGLLAYLTERVGAKLRESGQQACNIAVRLRYLDHYSAHQTMRLLRRTNDQRELLTAGKELFVKLFTRRVAIRHIGVSVTNLEADRRQDDLFDTGANRRWYLNREGDRVRRYGSSAVFCGKGLELNEHYATKGNDLVLSTACLSR